MSTLSFGHAPHYGKPNACSWSYSNQTLYDGRGRGRGGGWVTNGGSRDMDRGPGGRDYERFDNRRGEGSGNWRQEGRRKDCRGEANGPVRTADYGL